MDKDEFEINKKAVFNKIEKSFKNKNTFDSPFKADSETLSVTIIPTTDCNLRCSYCYADGGFDKKKLDFESAKIFLDKLISTNLNCTKINLYFAGGGEPLLNIELIKKLVDYVKNKGLKPTIRIVTNGTLVPNHIKWLKDNKVYLRISFDGSAQKVNRQSPYFNSAEKVENTFQILKKNYPIELLSTQMTITKENVNKMAEDVEKIILNYKIDAIKIESVHTSFSNRSKKVQQPTPKELVINYLKTLDNLVKKNIKGYIDLSYLSIPSTSYFCSLRNKAVLSPYNVITPCVEIIQKGIKDEWILCDDLSMINFDQMRETQKKELYKYHPSSYNLCTQCNLVHICKKNCPMRTILSENAEKYPFNCAVSKQLIPEFLKRAIENKKYMELVFGESYQEGITCD